MTKDELNILYDWLDFRFRYDNHKKYHKFFDEWINNVTKNQLDGFNNQFNSFIG
jgi:hypothetical protein